MVFHFDVDNISKTAGKAMAGLTGEQNFSGKVYRGNDLYSGPQTETIGQPQLQINDKDWERVRLFLETPLKIGKNCSGKPAKSVGQVRFFSENIVSSPSRKLPDEMPVTAP